MSGGQRVNMWEKGIQGKGTASAGQGIPGVEAPEEWDVALERKPWQPGELGLYFIDSGAPEKFRAIMYLPLPLTVPHLSCFLLMKHFQHLPPFLSFPLSAYYYFTFSLIFSVSPDYNHTFHSSKFTLLENNGKTTMTSQEESKAVGGSLLWAWRLRSDAEGAQLLHSIPCPGSCLFSGDIFSTGVLNL